MWKSLFCAALFTRTVHGYWLSKSDPICRDESFLYYWSVFDGPKSGESVYDVSNQCYFRLQTWFMLCVALFIVIWFMQTIPAIVNFIEGPERRKNCCDGKKSKKSKK